jgi:hypothetical protein
MNIIPGDKIPVAPMNVRLPAWRVPGCLVAGPGPVPPGRPLLVAHRAGGPWVVGAGRVRRRRPGLRARRRGGRVCGVVTAATRDLMHRMGHASMRAALVYQHANSEREPASDGTAGATGTALARKIIQG